MIGTRPTGAIEGVSIAAVSQQSLTILVDGKLGCIAVTDEVGNVVARGPFVARAAVSVAINCYRNLWRGLGHLRVNSEPVTDQPGEAGKVVFISAVAHEGLRVTIDGKPGRLSIVDAAGNVIGSNLVAREVEAVVVNSVRDDWVRRGLLRVHTQPPGAEHASRLRATITPPRLACD